MIEYAQTNLLRLSITWTGNKTLNEGTVIPESTLVPVHEYAHEVLLSAFFKPFAKNEAFYYFHHEEDISMNPVYQACVEIFGDPGKMSEVASKLALRMYEYSSAPKITAGEFFVALFDDVLLFGESVPAIGIFKVIHKDPFLRVEKTAGAFTLGVSEGISTGKLSLAALVFGVDEAEGYRIMAIDSVTKKDEPSDWIAGFLGARQIENNYYQKQQYMTMASDFISQKAPHQFGMDKSETADLMNRSAFYFKENENFEVDDFVSTLFEEPEKQEAFKEYKDSYQASARVELDDSFDISKQAVRKTNRVFKSVIKLDNNFQIYVKGRRDWIERGFDEEKGKPFYKIYFENEE